MTQPLRHLDLFSGIGGFALAVRWLGHRTVGFCEIDPWCHRVLGKNFPGVPIHDDIRTLTGTDFGTVDLLTGGFPCQPFSVAGKRRGRDDDRHLWPEMLRVIDEARPRYILGENVAGIIKMELDTIWTDLEGIGYSVGAVVVPAGAVNALHRRDRLWIMAARNDVVDSHQEGLEGQGIQGRPATAGGGATLADTDHPGLEGHRQFHAASGEAQAAPFGGGGAVPDTERERQPRPWAFEHASDPAPHREGQADHAVDDDTAGQGRTTPRAMDAGADGLSAGLVRQPATGNLDHADEMIIRSRLAGGEDAGWIAEDFDYPPEMVRQMWADGSWEDNLPRVVTSEEHRKQKLMGAGNAIVPQVAYEILRVMIGEATQ